MLPAVVRSISSPRRRGPRLPCRSAHEPAAERAHPFRDGHQAARRTSTNTTMPSRRSCTSSTAARDPGEQLGVQAKPGRRCRARSGNPSRHDGDGQDVEAELDVEEVLLMLAISPEQDPRWRRTPTDAEAASLYDARSRRRGLNHVSLSRTAIIPRPMSGAGCWRPGRSGRWRHRAQQVVFLSFRKLIPKRGVDGGRVIGVATTELFEHAPFAE